MNQEITQAQEAIGKCPKCKEYPTHITNEKAYCWGSKTKPHKEWRKNVPEN